MCYVGVDGVKMLGRQRKHVYLFPHIFCNFALLAYDALYGPRFDILVPGQRFVVGMSQCAKL